MMMGACGRDSNRVGNTQPPDEAARESMVVVLPGEVCACACDRIPPHLLSPGSAPGLLLVTNSDGLGQPRGKPLD